MKLSKTIKVKIDRVLRLLRERRYSRSMFKACGEKVFMHDGVQIHNPEDVAIGSEVYFGPGTRIFGFGGLSIGRGVVIGEGVQIMSSSHEYDGSTLEMLPFSMNNVEKPVEIGDFVWIGNGATILPGVKLGRYSVIGAAAVVTKDTEEFGVYGGNPARLLKYRANRDLQGLSATWVGAKPDSIYFID